VWRVLSVLQNVKVEGSIGKEWIPQIKSNGNVVSSKLGTPDHIKNSDKKRYKDRRQTEWIANILQTSLYISYYLATLILGY
jgi:hypothetical protein